MRTVTGKIHSESMLRQEIMQDFPKGDEFKSPGDLKRALDNLERQMLVVKLEMLLEGESYHYFTEFTASISLPVLRIHW